MKFDNFTLHGDSVSAELVPVGEIARLLAGDGHEALTRQAIGQFVAEGMPKAARGTYDPVTCLTWYVGRLRSAARSRKSEGEDGKQVSLDEVDIRLKTAKAESEEMSLAERRRELIPIHEHEVMLTSIVQVTKQRILNLPTRLAAKLEGLSTVEITVNAELVGVGESLRSLRRHS